VFEMTWDNDGRATFSYGEERVPASRMSSGGGSERTPSSPRRPARETGRRLVAHCAALGSTLSAP
jgi:hypothetical protein